MRSARYSALQRIVLVLILVSLGLAACGQPTPAPTPGPTALPVNAVRVLFTYGSEKQSWVEAVTATFNATNPRTAAGNPIVIEPVAVGSGESMDDVLEGRTQPVLWSPASALWLPLMNDQWQTQNGREILDQSACRNLVISPVVIMMWRPFAEAMGWPDRPISWADLAALATNPEGWGAYGHAEWGRFRFGHTHPDFSNSGLQTIVAMVYAAAGMQRGLTVDDVRTPTTIEFVRDLESSIAHYGRSTGFFGTAMGERGTQYLSAAVVYENVVIENNQRDARGQVNLEFPVVAIYPSDGTFLSDHPACILDADWVSDEQREAAGIYRDYLLGEAAQQQALQFGFRPADPNISLGSPIDAANGADPTQPQNTLSVPNAATIRAIRETWEQTKRQVNLALVIDVSASMNDPDGAGGTLIQGAKEGAVAFVEQLSDSDTLTLIIFSTGQTTLLDAVNVGRSRAEIVQQIRNLVATGGTSLFDAIAYAIDDIEPREETINAVVVLTDGRDTASTRFNTAGGNDSVTMRRAMNAMLDQYGMNPESTDPDVSIFTIGYGSGADLDSLRTIAQRGRGAFASGGAADIRSIYLNISTFF